MLHLQEKSCIYKKILHLQNNLAKARNLFIYNKILQKQEYLSTKCKGAMTSYGLGEDAQILLGHLFHVFYFIRIYHLNKILCSSIVVLPSYLPTFGCLTLHIVFDIFKYHLSDPYCLKKVNFPYL